MLSSLSCPGTLVRPRPSCTQAPHRRQRRFIPARALLLGEAADAGALAAAGSLLTAAAAGSPLAAIATPLAATGGPAAAAKLLVGGLAGAGLASLVPPPPPGLREPVSVDLEHTPVPLNTHGLKGGAQPPFQGRILEIRRVGGRDAERDVTHLVVDTGGVLFHEGQAFGVVPPGTKLNSKGKEVPKTVRLYSIASSRVGDRRDGTTCTLCVVRVVWRDENGQERRGVCSNYIADRKVGDVLTMTGPAGTAMLLPADHMRRRIVCVATGTGIAPFRSFWRRLFFDEVPGHPAGYQGQFWLLAGFANPDSELYGDELRAVAAANPGRFRLDIALSLQKNSRGGQEYVQDRIEENAATFLDWLQSDDCVFYFCGLKIMYTSVLEVLERMGAEAGVDVKARIAQLKQEHRWHVETA